MILPVTRFRFRYSFICQGTSTRSRLFGFSFSQYRLQAIH